MDNNNYMQAIDEAKDLLTELLNDPDHGKLAFDGLHDLDDLIITGPQELEDLVSGTVLAIDIEEWMAMNLPLEGGRHWQNFRASRVATSAELYIRALREPNNLTCRRNGF